MKEPNYRRFGMKIEDIFLNFYTPQDLAETHHYAAKMAQFEESITSSDWHSRYEFFLNKLMFNMVEGAVKLYGEHPNLTDDIKTYFNIKSLKASIIKDLYYGPNETIDSKLCVEDEDVEDAEWEDLE